MTSQTLFLLNVDLIYTYDIHIDALFFPNQKSFFHWGVAQAHVWRVFETPNEYATSYNVAKHYVSGVLVEQHLCYVL